MNTRIPTGSIGLVIALSTLLFVGIFAVKPAAASDCQSQYRMSHSNSDCLHAWWDNSPSASCWGTKGGAQSYCSNYGTVTVKIDLVAGTDRTINRNNSEKYRYENCLTDTRSISCCIDKSDLCVKNQVEADVNDKIKYFVSGNSTLQTANVGTRIERYNFCKDNPDTIYCDIDPEGDALWEPNCGDHDCTVSDCNWHWNQSDAHESSLCVKTNMAYDGSTFSQPKCAVSWTCQGSLNGVWRINRDTNTFAMWETDDLQECDLEVKVNCN